MKTIALLGAAAIILLGGYFLFSRSTLEDRTDTIMTDMHPASVQIVPIEHATGVLKWGDTVIYFDPVGGAEVFAGLPPADFVLVTDIHGDHLSVTTIAAVAGGAPLVVPQAVLELLSPPLALKASVLANGESMKIDDITIEATPMYNVPEGPDVFHTKGRGNGYLLEKDGYRVLIAGDTGNTPELRAMQNIDLALVPMNLPYTMSVEEAADAVLAFKPKVVYPYHYRGTGGLSDVQRFKQILNDADPGIEVTLANWYPKQ